MAIRVGIGGWTFEPWRGVFYPEGLAQAKELGFASRALKTIEINGTFYRNPTPKSCADWAAQAPEGFVFALKAPRYATNRRVLAEAGESVARFMSSGIAEMGEKLGPINWQFAPTKAFDPDDFARFLDLLPAAHAGVALRHAVEVRHPSFACADFVALARTHAVAIVYADHDTHPAIADITAPFTYARLMNGREEVETGYDAAALKHWAAGAQDWARGGVPEGLPTFGKAAVKGAAKAAAKGAKGAARDVFLYLINGAKVRAPAGAMALQKRVDG
jgi:uncharacterized protein YecE (DUF72 family)